MDSVTKIFGNDISVLDGKVSVRNEGSLKSDKLDQLVRAAVFGGNDEKEYARWLVWEIGQAVGVRPASIHDLYMARGRGEIGGFTVPAMCQGPPRRMSHWIESTSAAVMFRITTSENAPPLDVAPTAVPIVSRGVAGKVNSSWPRKTGSTIHGSPSFL